MGYSIDWRREFTTIDPHYSKFVEWQFKKLRDLGFITQGSHPVGWCPKDGSPVGQHDTLGDVEPEIGEYTLLKFRLDGSVLPTATLRPETVFGVTNIWVRPDLEYVKAEVGDETWVVSSECIKKLAYLNRSPVEKGRVRGVELVGKYALNPMTKTFVPILPASFVDPKNGTGVVMSVPAHAPYDYQALIDLAANTATLADYQIRVEDVLALQPIGLVESEGYSEVPARDIIQRKGIASQQDTLLEEATKELYAHEFHRGWMKSNTGRYEGLLVSEARDKVKADTTQNGDAVSFYELMNRPVVCRCGTECVVKIFENQWFINYGDAGWKEKSRRCAG